MYEARREDGSIMGLVIGKSAYSMILAIAETDKIVKVKNEDQLEDFREQTIHMCAEQVLNKTKQIL